jgi:hypothetical protein
MEIDAGKRPEWKEIAERSPVYNSCCAQQKSAVARNSVLVRK